MNLPVTVTDGQRLQVTSKQNEMQAEIAQISTTLNSGNSIQKVQRLGVVSHPQINNQQQQQIIHQNLLSFNKNNGNPQQIQNKGGISTTRQQHITLDEITNKVFNELMQGKVESHLNPPPRNSEQGSVKVCLIF